MTDLLIDTIGDAWVNSDRTGQNYGNANRIRVRSGTRWGFLLPELPNIAGRTVLDAYLLGRAAGALSSQTLTIAPVTERWSPGRVTYTNRPAIDSGADFTQSVPVTAAGGLVTIDDPGLVTILQSVANGADWYGLRLATSSGSSQEFVATDSGDPAWELVVILSDAPEAPENLRPNGGQISTTARTMAWDFLDLGGDSTEQAESWVQVDTPAAGVDPDEVSPDYSSGWQTNADPQWLVPAGPTFSTSESAPTFWRVNVKDADNNESGWSDWAEFWTATRPTLVIDSPTGAFGDITPQVLAHLSGGTVKSWKLKVTGPNRSDIRYETRMRTGAIDLTIPERSTDGRRIFREDEVGQIHLEVTPTGDWVEAVGSPISVSTWLDADWDEDAGVDPVTNLSVYPLEPRYPIRKWTWERTEAADAFLLQIDGVTFARLDELVPDAGVYEWIDNGQVSPLRPHALSVVAVDGGARSPVASVEDGGLPVGWVWVIPEATGIDPFFIDGTALAAATRTDYRATYVNAVGEEIDIFYGTPSRTFPFEGTIGSHQEQDVWAVLDRIEALRRAKNRNAQVVWGSESMRARIRDIDATPADEIRPSDLLHIVRFDAKGID